MNKIIALLLLVGVVAVAAQDDGWVEPEPPTDAEIKKMKVKELKSFLSDRGLKCQDCFEKGDYSKMVKQSRATPILASKRPRKVSKEPIQDQWKKVANDICIEEGLDEKKCKNFAKVVEGSFEMHGRRVSKQLHKPQHELAKTSFEEPYVAAGQKILKQVVKWMAKNNIIKQDPIREKVDNSIKMYLTAVGADNVNPMVEKLNERDDEL